MRLPALQRPGALAWALLAAALILPPALPAAALAVALAAVLGYLPGALAAARLAPAWGRSGRALFALGVSPFLSGACASALIAIGTAPVVAARVVVAALALWSVADAFAPRPRLVGPQREAETWIAALAWTAVVALLLRANPWLAPRSDGGFHAAVALQIAQRGVPPEDPFFAGLRLLYFWGGDAWAALWLALAPGLRVWTPLIALNLAGACAAVLGVCAIARRLGAAAGGCAFAAGLAVVGSMPFGWGWVAARALAGEVRGWDEVRRLIALGADPALRALAEGLLHPSLVFFGDKFLVLTPFALGLGLFAALVLALLDLIERPRLRAAAALAVLEAAALYLHTVVGLAFGTVAVLWVLWAAWRARRPEERSLLRPLPFLVLAGMAAAAALAPYLAAIALGKRSVLAWGLSPRALFSWLGAGALFVPAGMLWLVARGRRPGPARELLGIAVALTVLGLALRLPENNQAKFLSLLFVLLAPPAALGWAALFTRLGGPGRVLLAAGLALATLPTVGLCVWGFAAERGQTPESWHEPQAAERAALEWARTHTAATAVLADETGSREAPVIAARSTLWGGAGRARDWGYPEAALERRRRAVAELSAGREPPPGTRALLHALGRDLVVVARASAAGDSSAAWNALPRRPDRYQALYRGPGIILYRWVGQP